MTRLISSITNVLRNLGIAGILMGMFATGTDTILGIEFRFTCWEMLLIGLTSLTASYAIKVLQDIKYEK